MRPQNEATNDILLQLQGSGCDLYSIQRGSSNSQLTVGIIPLDFEMLDSAAPYYQAGLGNRLCYEITFNNYNQVTKSRASSPKVHRHILRI